MVRKLIAAPKFSFLYLFICLIATFLIYPFLSEYPTSSFILIVLISFILIFSLYALSLSKSIFFVGCLLIIPVLALNWLAFFFSHYTTMLLSDVGSLIFILYVIFFMSKLILTSSKTSKDAIFGATCIYLLIGIAWSNVYDLLSLLNAGAFSLALRGEDTIYYSFVTLTTLGYGDILPLTKPAKLFSAFEAVTGQLYLTVAIARLIGLYVRDLERSKK